MAFLALALARRGHNITYVAEEELSPARSLLGWQLPDMNGVTVRFVTNGEEAISLASGAEAKTVHLTQGLRSNGHIRDAQATIGYRGQRHFVVMETVNQQGLLGLLKPAVYSWELRQKHRTLDGILAIGANTAGWLRRLAPRSLQIYPFAYFLPERSLPKPVVGYPVFRLLFVGSLVSLKRVDLLLKALGSLSYHAFEVEIVGDGPLRAELENLAERILPGRVAFKGVIPISEVSDRMGEADCLVLPSRHDGWGAVVSEALLLGTPVICSAACGSHVVVNASGTGGVFDTLDEASFRSLLEEALRGGKVGPEFRLRLQSWALCLGVNAGANYLEALIRKDPLASDTPGPPWDRSLPRLSTATPAVSLHSAS